MNETTSPKASGDGARVDTSTWLTVAQAAQRLNVAERTVQRRCEKGQLEAQRVTTSEGVAWRINPASVPTAADIGADSVPTGAANMQGAATAPTGVPPYSGVNGGSVPTAADDAPTGVPTGADLMAMGADAELKAVAGEVHQLRGEIEQLKAFIAGGAMQALSERLSSLPDADTVRAIVAEDRAAAQQAILDAVAATMAERDEQRADVPPAATQADVAQAVERATREATEAAEKAAAAREQKLLDALASVRGELAELRENPPRRGFLGRLFGGG